MTLEEEIQYKLSNQIAKDIDFQILAEMLVDSGWTKVVLERGALPCSGPELHEWRQRNIKGEWKAHNNVWVFEKSEDAVVFTLRWR